MRTFHLLVADTLVASVTNNFLWFALTFWVYLETRSVLATAIIGGGYMLLVAVSGKFLGTSAGVIGLLVTVLALRSRPYRNLSSRYAAAPVEIDPENEEEVPAA